MEVNSLRTVVGVLKVCAEAGGEPLTEESCRLDLHREKAGMKVLNY